MSEAAPPAGSAASSAQDFRTTHWNVVLRAGETVPEGAAALDQLCRTYWMPIYAYVRRHGHSPEDAQDCTQDFFASLIARQDFAGLDRSKGKFRSFLLGCLNHFLAKVWRERRALKRGGGQTLVPLDVAFAEERLGVVAPGLTPERLYDQRWAMTVLEQAIASLQQEMVNVGRGPVFRELKGFLTGSSTNPAYDAVAVTLNMTPAAVAMTVLRLRKRYRELVRAALAQTVTTSDELDEEMRYLLEVLS